jgi:hypothetical protein
MILRLATGTEQSISRRRFRSPRRWKPATFRPWHATPKILGPTAAMDRSLHLRCRPRPRPRASHSHRPHASHPTAPRLRRPHPLQRPTTRRPTLRRSRENGPVTHLYPTSMPHLIAPKSRSSRSFAPNRPCPKRGPRAPVPPPRLPRPSRLRRSDPRPRPRSSDVPSYERAIWAIQRS